MGSPHDSTLERFAAAIARVMREEDLEFSRETALELMEDLWQHAHGSELGFVLPDVPFVEAFDEEQVNVFVAAVKGLTT